MNDCGISKLDLKRRNRMQILKVVREQGPISRVDISAILGITRAAVTIITNEMIDQHILQEVGEEPVNPNAEVRKGRRKILLDINETYKFAIGIYVDEKEISIGLTTLNAAALDKKSITHKADMTPEALAELLGTTLEKMLQNSCLTYENLLGIGVGIMPSAFEMMGGSTTDTRLSGISGAAKGTGGQHPPAGIHQQCRHRIRHGRRALRRPACQGGKSGLSVLGQRQLPCHSRQRQRSHSACRLR